MQKEKQAVDVPYDSSKCKRLLPNFRPGIGVLKQEKDVKCQTTIPLLWKSAIIFQKLLFNGVIKRYWF